MWSVNGIVALLSSDGPIFKKRHELNFDGKVKFISCPVEDELLLTDI